MTLLMGGRFEQGRLMIRARIDSLPLTEFDPLRLILDTGCTSVLALTQVCSARIGLPTYFDPNLSVQAGLSTARGSLAFKIPSLTIEELRDEDGFEVSVVIGLSESKSSGILISDDWDGRGVDGLLGIEALRAFKSVSLVNFAEALIFELDTDESVSPAPFS